MKCHLGTACSNDAKEVLPINDFRTGFRHRDMPACGPCIEDQPRLLQEHEEWQSRIMKAQKKSL